jgi:benzoyl-CoA reductase subunit BamB
MMPFGYAGKGLEIDLTKGSVTKTGSNHEHVEKFLGGRGIATKMFLDRVSPETAPFSPDNPLIFSAGLLTGTLAPGANRTALVTRSPQTGLLTYSTIGGFWGPEFKRAGYDTLLISGISKTPVYLLIVNDSVELKDASHLWGQPVRDTERILRQELRQHKVEMLIIGPAGENQVFASTIEHTMGAGAHRAGVGAVMGFKKLKAIVVHGTKDVQVANPIQLKKTCEDIDSKAGPIRQYWKNWPANNGSWLFNEAMHGNYEEAVIFENGEQILTDFVNTYKTRAAACFNCGVGCKSVVSLLDGRYAVVKCMSYFNFMFAAKICDIHFGVQCLKLCENCGLDVVSTAYLAGFAIDLYQKGIINRQDTGGLELKWQDREAAFALIEKIAQRKDIGDILAYGVVEAAGIIGRGAEKHAYHVKKLEPIPYTMDPYAALLSAVGDKPDQTRSEGFVASEGLEYYTAEWRKKYVKDGYFSYPGALLPVFENEYESRDTDYEKILPFASYDMDKNSLADCTGVCIFLTGFWQYNPIMVADHLRLIEYAAGIPMDEKKAMDAAKRSGIMTRAYNAMTGINREDDTVHRRFFETPSDAEPPAIDRQKFDAMISRFYKLRGWNEAGIPSAEELDRLGLQDIRLKLEQKTHFHKSQGGHNCGICTTPVRWGKRCF